MAVFALNHQFHVFENGNFCSKALISFF